MRSILSGHNDCQKNKISINCGWSNKCYYDVKIIVLVGNEILSEYRNRKCHNAKILMILKRLNFLYAIFFFRNFMQVKMYKRHLNCKIYINQEKVTFIVIISSKNCLASHDTLTINTINIQYSTITIIIVLIIIKMQNWLQCIIETTYLSFFQNSEAQNPNSDLIIYRLIYIYIYIQNLWRVGKRLD